MDPHISAMTNISAILSRNFTDCHSIAELSNDPHIQCELLRTFGLCQEDSIIDYAEIAFCNLQSRFLTLFVFGAILAILFVAISITADDFLCPLLVSISKSLNLSDNVAGVTFLALGNGAPDIFSSLSGIAKNDASLVIGQLYGGGIFVTTIVVGSILIRERFHIMHRPLLRDVMFYLVTTTLVFVTFQSGVLTLVHSLAFIAIYLVYVAVVIISGIIYRRNRAVLERLNSHSQHKTMPTDCNVRKYNVWSKSEQNSSKLSLKSLYVPSPDLDNFEGVILRRIKFRKYPSEFHRQQQQHQRRLTIYNIPGVVSTTIKDDLSSSLSTANIHYPRRLTISDPEFPSQAVPTTPLSSSSLENWASSNFNSIFTLPGLSPKFSVRSLISRSTKTSFSDFEWGFDKGEWQSLFLQMCRLEWEKTPQDTKISSVPVMRKILAIVKAPIYFIFSLTIPVVDRDEDNSGWKRSLNLLNILTAPQCFLLITQFEIASMSSAQLHLIAVGISLFLLPVVALTSVPDRPPGYHILFAYMGFSISVAWIYTIANEVVSLLKAVGIVFNISQFLLGLTFLAWGNSLGDLISNLSMAKNGFPRMAISACLGGPVLNMLLGMGIPYSYLLLSDINNITSIPLQGAGNSMVTVMYATIAISLVLTASMFVLVTKFTSTKSHGYFLYSLYAAFLATSVYFEYS